MEKKQLTYEVVEGGIDVIVEERGNTLIRLAEVSWNNRPAKLEVRKWMVNTDGDFTPNKGVVFSTPEGPTELVHALLENGFGDNKKIKEIMESRGVDLNITIEESEISDNNGSDYYDPREILEG